MRDIASLRRDYAHEPLDLDHISDDPFAQFQRWFGEARRVVLLKGVDARGFVFYTNRLSRKGIELAAEPRCALCFLWDAVARQVRVEGVAEAVDDAEVDAYFASRPRGSQLGAWASPQSEVVPSREHLDAALAAVTARFAGADVPRPPHWGGYRVVPRVVEFWQGRTSRLHDRLRYAREGLAWRVDRVAP